MFCEKCGAALPDGAPFCGNCGAAQTGAAQQVNAQQPAQDYAPQQADMQQPMQDYAPQQEQEYVPLQPIPYPPLAADPVREKKKGKTLLIIGVILFALAAVALTLFLTVHTYTEATCTEPSVCKICGKEKAPALGHDYRAATCTEPKICKRCGMTTGSALGHDFRAATCTSGPVCSVCHQEVGAPLGHDWMAPTYESPKTCIRCGQQTGNVLGYVSSVTGKYLDDTVDFSEAKIHPYRLDSTLNRCFRIRVGVKLTEYTGNPFGMWDVYAEDTVGNWKKIGSFYWSADDLNEWVDIDLVFDPINIKSLAIAPSSSRGVWSLYDNFRVDYAQQRVD